MKSKLPEVPKCSEDIAGWGQRSTRPSDLFNGPAADIHSRLMFGRLPEYGPEPKPLSAESGSAPAACRWPRVEFKRIPHDTNHSMTNDEAQQVPKKFQIMLSIGERIAVALPAEAFVEAFLAVVPRWFWKPKDERV